MKSILPLFFMLAGSMHYLKAQHSDSLMIGDPAPELKIEKWIRGGGPKVFEKGKIYLIDLWATWCGPCIAGMPHLSELQAKFRDRGLEVIGISNEDKYGNTLENVTQFVKKRDSVMNYAVAWVPPSGKDSEQGIWLHPWMQKTGLVNLPTCFLVDKNGIIVYIGDPFTIEPTLNKVINNDYSVDLLRQQYISGVNAEYVLSQFNRAIKAKKIDSAKIYGRQLLTKYTYVKPNTYLVMAWQVSHQEGDMDPELLDMGHESISRGIQLTNYSSPGFFDVLASIYAAKKDYLGAITAEKLAISLSEAGMKKNQEKNLEKYMSMVDRQ